MTIDRNQQDDELVHELVRRLKLALQRWRRSATADYQAFQTLVLLHLTCVEELANGLAGRGSYPCPVDDYDRQHAVWQLVREAVLTLRPDTPVLSSETRVAMERLPYSAWPTDLLVPHECHHYLTLWLAYVMKSHQNKHLAALFGISERSVGQVRNQAIVMIAHCIAAWEHYALQCRLMHLDED